MTEGVSFYYRAAWFLAYHFLLETFCEFIIYLENDLLEDYVCTDHYSNTFCGEGLAELVNCELVFLYKVLKKLLLMKKQ